jgi:hypothetical protein
MGANGGSRLRAVRACPRRLCGATRRKEQMKTRKHLALKMVGWIGLLLFTLQPHEMRAADSRAAQLNVMEMRSVPDGNYLVTLEIDGKELLLNLKVTNNSAKCVNSANPQWKGAEGKFQQLGIGTFRLSLQNEAIRATQAWIFRKDGSAAIREAPDRGELQKAVRVSDDSLTAPKRN